MAVFAIGPASGLSFKPQRPDGVRRRLLVVVGAAVLVHPVHVGGELDPPAARRVDEPEDVRTDGVPAEPPCLVPAPGAHGVGADDDLVYPGDLERAVVDPVLVGPMA